MKVDDVRARAHAFDQAPWKVRNCDFLVPFKPLLRVPPLEKISFTSQHHLGGPMTRLVRV